jgi:hypothetical protein
MSAARGARPATSGPYLLIATPVTAAVRWAVMGPPSRIAIGKPVSGSFRITVALMPGRPRAALVAKPATHFIPTRSSPGPAPR